MVEQESAAADEPIAEDEDPIEDAPGYEASGALEDSIARATVDLAAKTLKGDVRDKILELFRHRPKPWEQMLEAERRDLAFSIDTFAAEMIYRACALVAAGGRVTAPAQLAVFQQKGREVTAKLELAAEPTIIAQLTKACGHDVQILFVDPKPYQGQRKEPAADVPTDEPALPLEDPDGPDPDEEAIGEEQDDASPDADFAEVDAEPAEAEAAE